MRGNVVRQLAALAGVAFLAAGCIDSKAVLTVNPDGSATLEHTLYMKKDKDDAGGEKPIDKVKADMQKGVAQLGEGVTLASVTPAAAREGWRGYKIVYSVADVTKLKVGYLPPIGMDETEAADLIRFEFAAGPTAKLTVLRPNIKAGEDKPDGKEDENAAMAAAFEGAVLEFHIAVKGAIAHTNAEHVNAGRTGFLLLRQDIGGMLKDKAALAAAKAMAKLKDPEAILAKLQDPAVQKYVQMQSKPSVVVEFK